MYGILFNGTFDITASGLNIEIIKLLLSHYRGNHNEIYGLLSDYSLIDALKYYFQLGIRPDANVYAYCNKFKTSKECIKYLHTIGASFTSDIVSRIILEGSLDLLEYAIYVTPQHQLSGSDEYTQIAYDNQHYDCLDFLLQVGFKPPRIKESMLFNEHDEIPDYFHLMNGVVQEYCCMM